MTNSTAGARRSIPRAVQTTLVAIVTTGLIACGAGKDATTAPKTAAGTYALQKIDQAVPPTEIYNGSGTDNTTGKRYDQFIVTVNSGSLELDAEGHYHSTFGYRIVLDGKAENRTLDAQGTYEVNGKQIVLMRDNGVDTAEGTVEGGRVTMQMTLMGNVPNKPYVYSK